MLLTVLYIVQSYRRQNQVKALSEKKRSLQFFFKRKMDMPAAPLINDSSVDALSSRLLEILYGLMGHKTPESK